MMNRDDSLQGKKNRSPIDLAYDEFVKAYGDGKHLDMDEFCGRHPDSNSILRPRLEDFLFTMRGLEQETADPQTIGPYQILSTIGTGGMGVVYLAEQEKPVRRAVAVKVIKPGMDSRTILRRFESERQALALMEHPSITQIYETGTTADGQPFFAMEYIKGTVLHEYCNHAKVSLRDRLTLFMQICDAVQHAHQKGVMHRDLKPSNILVTVQNAQVIPKIIDFGLAKAMGLELSEQSLLTKQGDLIGTPAYMSPEQADPTILDVDTRTDIYSLGVVLYRLLTNTLPFNRNDLRGVSGFAAFEAIRKKVCDEDPQKPSVRVANGVETGLVPVEKGRPLDHRTLSKRLKGDLDWIVMKALEKDRNRRYPSANDLSADIERHLNHDPVLAGPPSPVYRSKKFVRKNARLVAAVTTVFLAVLAGFLTSTAFYFRSERNLESFTRMADIRRLQDRRDEANRFWPAYPDKIPAMEIWLGKSRELSSRLKLHKASLERLRKRAIPTGARSEGKNFVTEGIGELEEKVSKAPSWNFDSPEDQWLHDTLADLVANLEIFAGPNPSVASIAEVERRLDFATTVYDKTIESQHEAWSEAIASISSKTMHSIYNGLEIEPQIGLVPIGQDPNSNLWEFSHIQTGEIAERDDEGKILVTEKMGIVFVLIPGGKFWMGSQRNDKDKPNYNPQSNIHEGPVHEVTLKAFFLSKYEMTQGQWERFTTDNPSHYQSGDLITKPGLNPVEQVSAEDCDLVLSRLGLLLPTEPQWEYAARAGSTTIWWTGSDPRTLDGAANLADRFCKENGGSGDWTYEMWLDDGFNIHAPIGSYRANPFGLHDVHGNIWEWTRGGYMNYSFPTEQRDRDPLLQGDRYRVTRGGCFNKTAGAARSAHRDLTTPMTQANYIGLRPSRQLDL